MRAERLVEVVVVTAPSTLALGMAAAAWLDAGSRPGPPAWAPLVLGVLACVALGCGAGQLHRSSPRTLAAVAALVAISIPSAAAFAVVSNDLGTHPLIVNAVRVTMVVAPFLSLVVTGLAVWCRRITAGVDGISDGGGLVALHGGGTARAHAVAGPVVVRPIASSPAYRSSALAEARVLAKGDRASARRVRDGTVGIVLVVAAGILGGVWLPVTMLPAPTAVIEPKRYRIPRRRPDHWTPAPAALMGGPEVGY